MAAAGRTILFSSHILEEVERLADAVLVVYAGRLAASGDFRSIRRLMTDRPHTFTVRSSRRPAAGRGAARRPVGLRRRAARRPARGPHRRLRRVHPALPRIARDAGDHALEVAPTDDSLESVFSYLVRR